MMILYSVFVVGSKKLSLQFPPFLFRLMSFFFFIFSMFFGLGTLSCSPSLGCYYLNTKQSFWIQVSLLASVMFQQTGVESRGHFLTFRPPNL